MKFQIIIFLLFFVFYCVRTQTVYAWGHNYYGTVGVGTSGSSYRRYTSPQTITDLTDVNITMVAVRGFTSFAVTGDGIAYGWGYNGNCEIGDKNCEIGDKSSSTRTRPVKVSMTDALYNKTIIQIAGAHVGSSTQLIHTVALTSDGKVFAWGLNDNG